MNNNKDMISKYMLSNEAVLTACRSTLLVEKARELHHTLPTATAALGRVLTAAVMMASALKKDTHKLTLTLNGGSIAGNVMATANGKCEVKGYISNPQADLPKTANGKLDVGGVIGTNGFLSVSRDIGLKEPYTGKTRIVSGEVAEDLANYFLLSEQQPSIVYLGVWIDTDASVMSAGGLIAAPLPGAGENTISKLEDAAFSMRNFSDLLKTRSLDRSVREIFSSFDITHLTDAYPHYHCDCSVERLQKVIISLGEQEIKDIIEKDQNAEIVCRFCNQKYVFNAEQLAKLLKCAKKGV